MNPRTQDILNATIESFIRTGEPISSGLLFKDYNFGIKPAMIRHELESLTDEGFLDQPYHSAGRIPSDRGYEFFVSQILIQPFESSLNIQIEKFFSHGDWPKFLDLFSSQLDLLGVVELKRENRLYKSGLENLIEGLSFESQKKLKSIIRDFEGLDSRLEKFKGKPFKDGNIQIFIGRKSPVTESPELSLIAEKYWMNGEEVLLMAIGPKRMNYRKVVKTFKGIKESNQKHERRKSKS